MRIRAHDRRDALGGLHRLLRCRQEGAVHGDQDHQAAHRVIAGVFDRLGNDQVGLLVDGGQEGALTAGRKIQLGVFDQLGGQRIVIQAVDLAQTAVRVGKNQMAGLRQIAPDTAARQPAGLVVVVDPQRIIRVLPDDRIKISRHAAVIGQQARQKFKRTTMLFETQQRFARHLVQLLFQGLVKDRLEGLSLGAIHHQPGQRAEQQAEHQREHRQRHPAQQIAHH